MIRLAVNTVKWLFKPGYEPPSTHMSTVQKQNRTRICREITHVGQLPDWPVGLQERFSDFPIDGTTFLQTVQKLTAMLFTPFGL